MKVSASRFRVGDRVFAISPPDNRRSLVGVYGTVTRISVNTPIERLPICVRFDNGLDWWCEETSLEPEIDVDKFVIPYDIFEMQGEKR